MAARNVPGIAPKVYLPPDRIAIRFRSKQTYRVLKFPVLVEDLPYSAFAKGYGDLVCIDLPLADRLLATTKAIEAEANFARCSFLLANRVKALSPPRVH